MIFKKAKTRKGKKVLESKEPKLIENQKNVVVIKGLKWSEVIASFLRDFNKMRGSAETSKMFLRKSHDFHPFDNAGPMEQFSKQQDCSLICLGYNQKKRPDNFVIARTYDGRVLEQFEFEVSDFLSID
eukprot:CAMPEP_0170547518 /NCGR_PEP_ID=MMETSP0211-20121228/5934_1 /TAXON_ID=311385 /ORGANISM="Pseudokeronopsis sp., Strain OXSARD2" /LENGTH=127 /DNA_ID=CAMNT_0010852625 /DNA_START=27 /DNA_END=410 /DNA_ORIENTATION=+